jgi:NhaA family Na+:H+ antiporter
VGPFARFLHVEAAGGIVLVAATAIALILANTPWADAYLAIWKTKLTIGLGDFQMSHSLKHWISDALMAVFFFVIGLELKREVVSGQLRDLHAAALPIAAALGGMLAPAGIYLALQWGEPGLRGWGIPMATDIAFVVGCMAVLGSRVPGSLRVLLLSLAITDDLGAILVIAIGYTESLAWSWLALSAGGIGVVWTLEKLGVRSVPVYVMAGFVVWLGFHESGVHATMAGVILGLMTPTRSWVSAQRLRGMTQQVDRYLHGERWNSPGQRRAMLREMEIAARETISPLERLENTVHPWQSFAIIPLFGLANAGVPIEPGAFLNPIAVAVALGLAVGKPLGIVLVSWLAVRAGVARLPAELSWGVVTAGGCLAGIGFTMSLFIAGLALEGESLVAAKVGVLSGSVLSGALGMTLLMRLLPRERAT